MLTIRNKVQNVYFVSSVPHMLNFTWERCWIIYAYVLFITKTLYAGRVRVDYYDSTAHVPWLVTDVYLDKTSSRGLTD